MRKGALQLLELSSQRPRPTSSSPPSPRRTRSTCTQSRRFVRPWDWTQARSRTVSTRALWASNRRCQVQWGWGEQSGVGSCVCKPRSSTAAHRKPAPPSFFHSGRPAHGVHLRGTGPAHPVGSGGHHFEELVCFFDWLPHRVRLRSLVVPFHLLPNRHRPGHQNWGALRPARRDRLLGRLITNGAVPPSCASSPPPTFVQVAPSFFLTKACNPGFQAQLDSFDAITAAETESACPVVQAKALVAALAATTDSLTQAYAFRAFLLQTCVGDFNTLNTFNGFTATGFSGLFSPEGAEVVMSPFKHVLCSRVVQGRD